MIDVLGLRSEVADLLEGVLGVYRFSNNLTTPAIRVMPSQFAEEPTIEGLEVVISIETEIDITPMSGGDKSITCTSEIALIQWDNSASTKSAREILIKNLDIISVSIVPRIELAGNVETCTLKLEDGFHYFGSTVDASAPEPETELSLELIVAGIGT